MTLRPMDNNKIRVQAAEIRGEGCNQLSGTNFFAKLVGYIQVPWLPLPMAQMALWVYRYPSI